MIWKKQLEAERMTENLTKPSVAKCRVYIYIYPSSL